MRKQNRSAVPARLGSVPCAIYTRKSSDEGLEQEFNSLDAQREACEAFIRSQKHEGWVCLPDAYDDGGISGGTMDRPALQRLLADIQQGKVRVVVVYKVDRLTRSLSDFARIVEIFDARGVSFVSVTQQFNTTTSMGRLTLNVLLSFAQFEREVTGERIRDKIAASKKKGMWMGGPVPLGYDVKDRKLLVNETEAETVRLIFRRYADFASVHALKQDLDARGVVSKIRVTANGRRVGGNPIARGALYTMLQNPIYRGEIRHRDRSYPGEHAAIIDQELWDKVQAQLAENTVERRSGLRAGNPSLLAGLLFDDRGHRMVPSHARKGGRRYRYYVSKPLIVEGKNKDAGGRRIPAADIERIVVNRLRLFLSDGGQVFDSIQAHVRDQGDRKRLVERATEVASTWPELPHAQTRSIMIALVARVDVHADRVGVHLLPDRLDKTLHGDHSQLPPASDAVDRSEWLSLGVPAQLRRTGMEVRLIVEGHDPYDSKTRPDPSLIKLIVRAHQLHDKLVHNGGRSLESIAAQEGMTGSYFTRVVRLAWLAPDITRAILNGRQPYGLTAAKLLRGSWHLPVEWTGQRQILEFA
jgi:DNA invertase Pin-like site-specific DNA recombinase